MAEVHLDHPGEVTWFAGYGPAPVIGPCPHTDCSHDAGGTIAWGPDFEHYTLSMCKVPAVEGGCDGACRGWSSEIPSERGGVTYGWGPYLQVHLGALEA